MPLPNTSPGLVVQAVDRELLVYDPDTTRVHRLEPLAATVFQACRQGDSEAETAARVGASELARALAELEAAGLVVAGARGLSRRQALALGGAALVTTLTVPLPAAAQSAPCVVNCVASCNGTNLCAPATPGPAPDALCATTFCGAQYTFAAAGGLCADPFVTFGCFTEGPPGATIRRSCAEARGAASAGGEGTPYACCDCPPVP